MTHANVAHLNSSPAAVAGTTELRDAIISMGDFATGADAAAKNARRLTMIGHLADKVGRVRMLGSAATDLAWLAAGRLDAVVIDANRTWDVAAGIALVRAAGATITHIDGGPYTLAGRDVLATVPGIHDAIVTELGCRSAGA